MKLITYLMILFWSAVGFAQVNPIDFEVDGQGAEWTWTVFENDTNPSLEIVDNPDPSGSNTSAKVAKFTALADGMPFAGVESMHGADIGTFTIGNDNAFVKILVWKSVISDVGIKYATPAGGSTGEIKVANTLVNEWETLIFDFTDVIGIPETINVDQIIVFPDFRDRTEDAVIYFDAISFGDSTLSLRESEETSMMVYPNPVSKTLNLRSDVNITELKVYTLLGVKVMDIEPNTNSTVIDVSKLSKGIYLLSTKGTGKERLFKFIKN